MKNDFKKAFQIALQTEWFQNAVKHVDDCIDKGERSACYFFAVDGIVYYYGFDGVNLRKGAHNDKRSAYLIAHTEVPIVK